MQLERFAVELRPRNGFESLDLGFAMFRAWRGPLMRAWLVTYVPVALVSCLALWEHPTIAFLVVWWLKPLFDRVLLYVYSQSMFGVQPTARDVLRALPQLVFRTRLLAALTTFRLSMARSLFLPVWQLEGQRGAAARARRGVLGARTYGFAVWLTFVCVNVASFWVLGGITIMGLLTPEDAGPWLSPSDFLYPDADKVWLHQMMNVLAFCADTVIEPYFVGAGFSLYLNRRSELEGWDLEVEFRRMSQRHASARAHFAPVAIAVVALGLALTHADVHATAAAAEPAAPIRIESTPLPAGVVKRELKAVLEDPVFGPKETRSRWITRERESTSTPAWLRTLRNFMKSIAQAVGEAGRVLIWVGGAIGLAVALYFLIRHHQGWLRRNAPRVIPPTLFGLDVRPGSLPPDVAAAARAALANGDARAALSLLYRGALVTLIHAGGVDFRNGDTEGECWRRAVPVLTTGGGAYFRALLDAWLVTAYAHRPPPRADLEALCEHWPGHFGAQAFTTVR